MPSYRLHCAPTFPEWRVRAEPRRDATILRQVAHGAVIEASPVAARGGPPLLVLLIAPAAGPPPPPRARRRRRAAAGRPWPRTHRTAGRRRARAAAVAAAARATPA
jgi:hypothetical protein